MSTRVLMSLCPSCLRRLGARRAHGAALGRVVVVHKTSRLDFERMRNRQLSEEELARKLSASGEDYYLSLLQRHSTHERSLQEIHSFLTSEGRSVRMRNRETYSLEDVEWADTILTAGGDGSFLFTASKVMSPDKLVVGLNTDPSRSEGFLCVRPSSDSLTDTLRHIFNGQLKEVYRQRIRVTVGPTTLPIRALNEVFIGERDHSHASYYELCYDGSTRERQKSSGLLIYTGTGSTSWAYNVNKFTAAEVRRLLNIAQREGVSLRVPADMDVDGMVDKVTEMYNSSNVFSGEKPQMAFAVREPIVRGIFASCKTHGYTSGVVSIRSCSWNTRLVIDGQFHYDLGFGSTAVCELHPQDALRTVDILR